MKKILFFIMFICLTAPASSYAINGKSTEQDHGMGGAGVAAAYGSDGQYWNPATLADTKEHSNDFFKRRS
jgi:multisubunit Na+/H+ antiporter MnhG subunit